MPMKNIETSGGVVASACAYQSTNSAVAPIGKT